MRKRRHGLGSSQTEHHRAALAAGEAATHAGRAALKAASTGNCSVAIEKLADTSQASGAAKAHYEAGGSAMFKNLASRAESEARRAVLKTCGTHRPQRLGAARR